MSQVRVDEIPFHIYWGDNGRSYTVPALVRFVVMCNDHDGTLFAEYVVQRDLLERISDHAVRQMLDEGQVQLALSMVDAGCLHHVPELQWQPVEASP
jgi:creatinine amidohydrolase/Fe(II)-dependent formamide hydrolase-like protein